MIVVIDCLRCGVRIGLEDVAFFELVNGDVEAGAEVDCYADLEMGCYQVVDERGGAATRASRTMIAEITMRVVKTAVSM